MMFFNLFRADGLKGAEPDVKRNFRCLDPALRQLSEDLRSEMESGSRSGNGAAFPGVDSLIAGMVHRGIGTRDVGRERDVANLFHPGEEVVDFGEADAALAEVSAGNNFRLEFIVIAEEELLAYADLAPGPHQAFPFVGIFLQLAGEQDFNASAKKITGRGIAGTQRLGLKTFAASIKARGKHFCVVEHDEVAGTKERGEIAKSAILEASGRPGEVQQARRGPIRQRLLGN